MRTQWLAMSVFPDFLLSLTIVVKLSVVITHYHVTGTRHQLLSVFTQSQVHTKGKKVSSPILVTERWARNWSWRTCSRPAADLLSHPTAVGCHYFPPGLSLPRKHSPDGATTVWGRKHLIAAHYSFIDPVRKKVWEQSEMNSVLSIIPQLSMHQ